MEWLGLVGALAGSTITGLLALWLDSLRGKRDALEAKNQREHERIERRYQDRLDAYAAFDSEAVRQIREANDFMEEHGGLTPEEVGYVESELTGLRDALSRVQLLGSPELGAAAAALADRVHGYVWGSLTHDQVSASHRAFREAAQKDLNGG